MRGGDMKTILKGKILTIPNLLSLVRILLIPIFVWFYHIQNIPATVITLTASAVTDVLDGLIARRFHMVSDFGKALDPFADKLTQFAMLCCLLVSFPQMIWLIFVLVVKELYLLLLQLTVIQHTDVVLGAAWYGKVTTVLLYAVMLLHLVWQELPPELSWALVFLCMFMLLLSGVLYSIRAVRSLKAGKTPSPESASDDTPPENEKTA